jgi:hypothetical protein
MRHFASLAVLFPLLASAMLVGGCTTLSAGSRYTLAKMNRDGALIEGRRVIEDPNGSDDYDQIAPRKTIGVKLNSGFVRYLQSIQRPEIAIFVKAVVREPNKPDEGVLWEKVYLASEDEKAHIVLNKNSAFPRSDIYVLPPISYYGQDITIQLRVIEIDKDDNARIKTLLSAAAATTAEFKPEAAVAISVVQTVLNFLVANNADDIEFSYDIQISRDIGDIVRSAEAGAPAGTLDLALSPRAATYVAIKTEHKDRMNLPSDYIQVTTSGVRYALAQVLKIGTLGILNWPMFNPDEDRYLWIMGRPFAVDFDSWAPPVFANGRLIVNEDGQQPIRHKWPIRRLPAGVGGSPYESPRRELLLLNEEVWTRQQRKPSALPCYDQSVGGDTVAPVAGHGGTKSLASACYELRPFTDQSYMVFSVVSPDEAVDAGLLKAALDASEEVKKLDELHTTQMSTADFTEHVTAIADSVKTIALQQQLLARCKSVQREAKSEEDRTAAKDQCKAEREAFVKDTVSKLSPNLRDAATKGIDSKIKSIETDAKVEAGRREARSSTALDPASQCVSTTSPLTLAVTCAAKKQLRVLYRPDREGAAPKQLAAGACDADGHFTVTASDSLPAGSYALIVRYPAEKIQKLLPFTVVDEGGTCPG